MIWLLVFLGTVVVGLFLYWALVITEGTYLGRRIVALLYDWTPGYYDRIKEITWNWNTFYDQVWVRRLGGTSLAGHGADDLKVWLLNPESYSVQDGIVKPQKRVV